MNSYNIFKFSAINKNLLDSLIKNYVYCASPNSLNDPFDCRVDISESIVRAIDACEGSAKENLKTLKDSEPFLDFVKESIFKSGICSFSRNLLKPVLWSHYADEHRGVCCMYDIPSGFLNFKENNAIGITDVGYGENILTEELIKNANDLSSMSNAEIFSKIVIPIFSSKGNDWGNEEEIRIVKGEAGPLQLKDQFLKQICFGLHTSEKDKELIRTLVHKCGYNPDYCEIVKSNSDFGLDVNDL